MSANNNKPHVVVLPEDDANRQLANGFSNYFANRQFQVLSPAGGWRVTIDLFLTRHLREMKNPNRYIILLIDCDNHPERLDETKRTHPA